MADVHQKLDGAGLWQGDLYLFESLPSTNAWALTHAAAAKRGDVVRALRQTEGRGRFDRRWVAPGRCCVTVSVILKEAGDSPVPPALLLPASALAVAATLRQFRIAPALKWPNDVLVGPRKIAGILAEGDTATGTVVLGIGLNVNITAPALLGMDFPVPPTSMAVEKDRLFDTHTVCNELLSFLEGTLDRVQQRGPEAILAEWGPFDALTGKAITVAGDGAAVTGHYRGMRPNGQLCLVDSQGREHLFWSGDVSVVP